MNRPFAKFLVCLVAGFALLGGLGIFTAQPVLAQVEEGLETVGEQTGLSASDPKMIIANIIYVGLGFLGVLAILIVLYGGFTWMTAAGSEEKVERAKKILVRGAIGVAIILMSYAIASFIIGAILGATNGGNGSGGSSSGGNGFSGGGSTTSFTVRDYSPEGEVAIRNIQYRVTFTSLVDGTTLDGNITITNDSTGEVVPGSWSTVNNRATFIPTAACPSPNEDRFCFDADTTFSVSVSENVKNANGRSLVCSATSCASTFTSGNLVDTEDPEVVFTVPESGDGVPTDSVQAVQVHATDDSQVAGADFALDSLVFDSVGATGDDLSDVSIATLWDTIGVENGERYQLISIVTDIAGNTSEDSVAVEGRPAWCFNGIEDTALGETGLDCGGDASSAEYCGACDGSACSDDSECSSGNCVAGVCLSLPEITSISPASGAPGTYVTISGSGFGNGEGTVVFTSADGGTTAATIPTCAAGWSDGEIVVEVPADAADGAITLTTTAGNSESTNDENGLLIEDFDVTDEVRPKLCALSPNGGGPTDAVTLSGFDFGDTQGTSTVTFDDTAAGSYTGWSETSVSVTAPSANDGYYDVTLTVDGLASNALTFALEDESSAPPSIAEISPSSGAIGQYVTMTGTNFGARTGTVWFVSEATGESALAETDFPAACGDDYWDDGEITVIVPSVFTSERAVDPGAYSVYVRTAEGDDSATVDFVITSGEPAPGICAITPETGEAGETVIIYGERLGSTDGTVTFYDETAATVTSWGDESIAVTVPGGAVTGPVMVTSSEGEESNTVNFSVGEGDGTVAATAGPATYGWYFSTGEIPARPEIVVECTDSRVSAVPNARFTDQVCTNAVVYAEFSVPMDEATIDDAVKVYRCSGTESRTCTTEVEGVVTTESSASLTSFTFRPTAAWATSTSYRVVVSTLATSAPSASGDVTPLRNEVTWDFTTKATDDACEIEEVRVSPDTSTIDTQYGTDRFSALPTAGCVVLDPLAYAWSWSVDESYAAITASSDETCDGGAASCATVIGNAEGTTLVTAEEAASSVDGSAELRINFTDPYVEQYQPDCSDACTGAKVSATFNTPMREISIESSGVHFYECANELCVNLTEVDSYTVACTDDADLDACEEVVIEHGGLTSGGFYRVVISGDVLSTSGLLLTRTNYSGDFSWTFRVRDDGVACAIERLAITPDAAIAEVIGDRESFEVSAYSSPDTCSVEGQELAVGEYSWDWTNPIVDVAGVAEWWQDGNVDTYLEDIENGCTASCVASGSEAWAAICGDSVIGPGEDCDDGGTVDGGGCSSSCVREGGDIVGICGDGVLDREADGSGEDCDDGNERSGDGCSSLCLNEGSAAVGAECGNGDLAYSATTGGEECEDGNVRSGDGCSNRCLNEGSVTFAQVDSAVCGNGIIDTPYENCDTALSAEGCSSTCLLEGSSANYSTPSSCSDAVLGIGEECIGGNTVNGDGCSSICLLEGSSLAYEEPSVCGDGVTGTGEWLECESDGGDGYIDSLQLAEISIGAARVVDSDTRQATATVVVEEPVSGLTTSASYTLMCTATLDTDCPDSTIYGVSENSCCMERPSVSLIPNGGDTCRNASIYGVFTSEMDLSSFMTSGDGVEQPRMYAKLDLAASGLTSCPSDHTTLARAPRSWAARTWFSLRSIVTGIPAHAATGDCVVDVTGYSQTVESVTNGTYRVTMGYETALQANATYTIVLDVDGDATDTLKPGVLSADGVAILARTTGETTEQQAFTTGNDICTLDEVSVEDIDDSAYYFSQTNEQHEFTATALSYTTGTAQEITSLPTVYAWEWTSWTDDTNSEVVAASVDSVNADQAAVRAVGANGDASVVATATITADTLGASLNEEISGAADVTAYLCENPWPEISVFPWQDNATGGVNLNAFEGDGGWMNFSTYYCRDAGSETTTTDDYEPATVVLAETRDVDEDIVLKEYLLEVGDEGDAIGIRIVSNPEYLSPAQWFASRGFSGDPSETEVDGFAAVTDGRTTYISAPNETDAGVLYSNIYVISYNEGAASETIDIYEQLLANFSFATNVESTGLCYDGIAATETFCDDDSDCSGGATCADDKAKLRRDTLRLADITDTVAVVETYSEENGVIPALTSGTYVRALGASAWSSWSDALGGALDADDLAADPLNAYQDCGSDAYADYDAATCVNQTKGQYVCPADSYVYHYRAIGDASYELYADLEYDTAVWKNAIDADSSDAVTITVGGANASTTADGFASAPFCDGTTVYGSETSCGDGVVGGSETCELGQRGGATVACDANDAEDGSADADTIVDNDADGTVSQTCNTTCNGWVDDANAVCVSVECGDGVIDTGETCDDGVYNGRYGYCGSSCNYDTAFFCGDGTVSGSEACDCGAPSLTDAEFALIEGTARPSGGTPGMCAGVNGTYSANAATTCAWDCSGEAPFCGDGEVTLGEQCDGDTDTYDGAICCGGADDGDPCTNNADCGSSEFSAGYCGRDAAVAAGVGTFFLSAYCPATVNTNACEPTAEGYATTRTMNCEDDGSAGEMCVWETNAWENIACEQVGTCGDGTLDAGEECDDGNIDSTDSCTSSCKMNVCGDGSLYVGEEQCDEGADNGGSCDANYGSSCTACSATCRYVVASGEFCGDGIRNGTEYCDAYEVPYMWYDRNYATANYPDGDGLIGPCYEVAGTSYRDVYADSYSYVDADGTPRTSTPMCMHVGICNGGEENGEHCTIFDSCGTGTCILPTCADSCNSTCPFTYDDATVLLTSNQVGARASSTANMYSYDSESTSDLPNAATITVPACDAISAITADISMDGVEPLQTYVVFITDLSPSMSHEVSNNSAPETGELSRYELATASLEDAVGTLYDELGENVHIGLVGYKTMPIGRCYASAAECSVDADCGTGDICNAATTYYQSLGFTDEGDEYDVVTEIQTYFPDQGSFGTPMSQGVTAAEDMLDAVYSADEESNTRYIAVLLSDGNLPTGASDPAGAIESLKERYELYTATISDTVDGAADIAQMAEWSSGNPAESGIDYAYDAQTEAELTQMYRDIIDSILGIVVQIISSDGTTLYTDTATIEEGTGIALPWPEGFTCDPDTEQDLPIRLTFNGVGQIEVSNVRVNYCAP